MEKFELSKIPASETEPTEKVLNPEEAQKLGQDMGEYTKELGSDIEKIKAKLQTEISEKERTELQNLLAELEEQYEGLGGFVSDIKEGNQITEK